MEQQIFVGRLDALERLERFLTQEPNQSGSQLTIQSVWGGVGVGKSTLVNRVVNSESVKPRGFLKLSVTGVEGENTVFEVILRLISSVGDDDKAFARFNRTRNLIAKVIDAARRESEKFQRRPVGANDVLDAADAVTEAIPILKKFVNVKEIKKHQGAIAVGTSVFDRALGYFYKIPGEDQLLTTVSRAFVDDLNALLAETNDLGQENSKRMSKKNGLLLILDDFEFVKSSLEGLLLSHLIADLASARFQTKMLVVGRDRLAQADPKYEQAHREKMALPEIGLQPLTPEEVTEVLRQVSQFPLEKISEAYAQTRGVPWYLLEWVDEQQNGGMSAASTIRVYKRVCCWLDENQREWLNYMIFLDRIDLETVGLISNGELNSQEVKEATYWLRAEPTLRSQTAPVICVHDFLRIRLKKYLLDLDAVKYRDLDRRAKVVNRVEAAVQ